MIRKPYIGTATVSAGTHHLVIESKGETAKRFDHGSIAIPSGASHAAVLCANTGDVLALTGPSCDPEAIYWARLAAVAPRMRATLEAATEVLRNVGTQAARDALHDAAVVLALAGPRHDATPTEQCDHCGVIGQRVNPTDEGLELCRDCTATH